MVRVLKHPLLRGLVGGLLLVVGLVFGFITGAQSLRQIDSESWPTASGVIVSATADESTGRRGRTVFTPRISFRYFVDGVEYTSDRLAVLPYSTTSTSKMLDLVLYYPAGKRVNVAYDPDDPSFGVLLTDIGASAVVQPIVMGVVALLGLFILASAFLQFKPKELAATDAG